MTNANEPAREAVARAIYEAFGYAYSGRTIGASGPYSAWATACKAADSVLAISASPAPAAGGLEAVLTMALQALEHSKPVMAHYEEPVARHKAALEAVKAALASPAATNRKPFRMLVDREWLREKIANDPDDAECEVRSAPAATSGPTYVVNCCNCGRITDTREESEGGDQWGHELSDDRWVCSPECLDAVTDPDAVPAATSAETQGGDGVREAELVRAASALLNNLWQDVWSHERTHEENWKEFDRKYPGVKWLRDARDAALAPSTSAATTGEPVYRFLSRDDVIEAGDECPTDNCAAWERVNRWAVGSKPSAIFKTIRRRVASPPAPAVESAQVKAWRDVLDERLRQAGAEGWTDEHDDGHDDGELALAAACYALPDWQRNRIEVPTALGHVPLWRRLWPWAQEWWKPKSVRSDLVKAGALILAEIERLDRASLELATTSTGADNE